MAVKWFENIPTLTRSANTVWKAFDQYKRQLSELSEARRKQQEQAERAQQEAISQVAAKRLETEAIRSGRMLPSGKYPKDTYAEAQRKVRQLAIQQATDEFRILPDTDPNDAEVTIQEYINRYYSEQAAKSGDTEAAKYYGDLADWIYTNKRLPSFPGLPSEIPAEPEAAPTNLDYWKERGKPTPLWAKVEDWFNKRFRQPLPPLEERMRLAAEAPPTWKEKAISWAGKKATGAEEAVDLPYQIQVHSLALYRRQLDGEELTPEDEALVELYLKEAKIDPARAAQLKHGLPPSVSGLEYFWPKVLSPDEELKEAYYESASTLEQTAETMTTPASIALFLIPGTAAGARAGLGARLTTLKAAPVATRGAKAAVIGIKVARGALLPVEVVERAIQLPFEGAAKLVQGRRLAAKWNSLNKAMRNEIEPIFKKVDDGVPLVEADYVKLAKFDADYSKALKDMAARTKPPEVVAPTLPKEVKAPKVVPEKVTPAVKPEAAEITAIPSLRTRKLLPAKSISDFDLKSDIVVRRGERTFIVDQKGIRADVEVQSDVISADVKRNLANLTPEQQVKMAEEIRRTPYLSAEGKTERLTAIAEAKVAKPRLAWYEEIENPVTGEIEFVVKGETVAGLPTELTRFDSAQAAKVEVERLKAIPPAKVAPAKGIVPKKGILPEPKTITEVPHEPITGEQAGMLGVPGKVHVQKRDYTMGQVDIESFGKYQKAMEGTQYLGREEADIMNDALRGRIDEIGRSLGEGEDAIGGISTWLRDNEKIAKLTELIPTAPKGEGELAYITKGQYLKHWGRAPRKEILTADGKRVRWEYALDELAKDLGLEDIARNSNLSPDEYLKQLIEYAARQKDLLQETKRAVAFDANSLKNIEKVIAQNEARVAAGEPKIGDLAFKPKNLQSPDSVEGIRETEKLIRRSEIAKEFTDSIGVSVRHGLYRGKAAGIYKEGKEIIRYKWGDVRTVSHESAHFLDEKLKFSSKITAKELNPLLVEYQVTKATKKHSEAFAEFMRYYITEPVKAKARAPKFHAYFEKTLGDLPELKESILNLRADYERWLNMPSTAKVLSQISVQEETRGLAEMLRGSYGKFQRDLINDLYPLRKFRDLATKTGAKILPEEDPYIAATLLKGQISKANEFIDVGTFGKKYWTTVGNKVVPDYKGPGLSKILKPVNKPGDWQDLMVYLTARRARQLEARGIRTGINKADAIKAISELEMKYHSFPEIADDLYAYQRQLLNYARESGLLSEKLYKTILARSDDYVPFYRVAEELQRRGYLGKKMADIASPIKRIKGSERDIVNPLESIIKNTYTILSASDRNQVGIMMAKLAEQNADIARMFEKIPTPVAKVASVSPGELGLKFEGLSDDLMEQAVDIFRPSVFKPQENIVTVLIDGKKTFFKVDPDLYKAMMAIDRSDMGMLMRLFSLPAKWLRAGAVWSPDFIMKNPMRDSLQAFIYSEFGFFPYVDTLKGVAGIAGKDNAYHLFHMAGADHSMFVSMDRQYLRKSFSTIVEGHKFKDYIKHPLELLQVSSEIMEKATRLGEFKLGLKESKSPVVAAAAARKVTLDFGIAGTQGRAINAIVPFWNANIRDWATMFTHFKQHPFRTSLKCLTGITLPSVLLYMANRNDPRWKEIPQWQKDIFWIIMTDDHIYRVPKPFVLGLLFGSAPERLLEWTDTHDPDLGKQWAESMIQVGSPGFIPQALLPFIETWANKNLFRGVPIVPLSREDLPPELQYSGGTSETAKKLGELFGVSPAHIDNWLYEWTGTLGRYATDISDEILKGTGIVADIPIPSPTLADRPVVRAFAVRNPYGSSSASVDKFYDTLSEYEGGEKYLKEMLKLGEPEKFEKYKAEHPELLWRRDLDGTSYSQVARFLRKVSRELSDIRGKQDKVYHHKTLTPEEKRRMIDEYDKLKTQICQQAMEVVKGIENGKIVTVPGQYTASTGPAFYPAIPGR